MNIKCIECDFYKKIKNPKTMIGSRGGVIYPDKHVCTHESATKIETIYNPLIGKSEVTIALDIYDEALNAKNNCKFFKDIGTSNVE